MLNLLGCNKDNFKKLLEKMNYKIFEKDENIFLKYNPIKKFNKKPEKNKIKNNAFNILKNINFS